MTDGQECWTGTNTADLIQEDALEIGDGYRAKNSEFRPGGGLPFVRVGDVSDRVETADLDELPAENGDAYEPKVSRPGDCLITMKGTVGRVAQVDRQSRAFVYSPQISYWRVKDRSRLLPEFLRYWLRGAEFEHQAFATKSATDMADYINLRDQRRMQMTLPPIETQRRIAAPLIAIDELIDVNKRRIGVLDGLIHGLYREWFTAFRFPGSDGLASSDSELGPIPDGWQVRTVGEVFDVIGGGTPSKKREDYWLDGDIPWFTPSDLTRSRRRFVSGSATSITELGLKESSARKFQPGSVLMTSRATLGVLAVTEVEATCNQGFIVIPPTTNFPSEFIYEWLRSNAVALESIATGATFNEISRGAFKRFPILLPPSSLLEDFGYRAGQMARMISSLERINRKVAAVRDSLLPQLVAGNVDVSNVDLDALILDPR